MGYDAKQARVVWRNSVNNAQGHIFEDCIKAGCSIYRDEGRAEIDKTPEPFRVTSKGPDGTFAGRFTALAQPDFQGTLDGGRSIVFEAKYTTTDRAKRSILTDTQMKVLEQHDARGALSAVCVGIQESYYFIPWAVWRDMKQVFGRQYVTAGSLEVFKVKFTGAILFLDYLYPTYGRWLSGADYDPQKWKRDR